MKELIEIFNMEQVSKITRANTIINLGTFINEKYQVNLTEPIVIELVAILVPNHKVLTDEHYLKQVKLQSRCVMSSPLYVAK